ncbi:Uncharacterised protein [Enterobacter kobei]|uniref:hypothetical protein n=1 Tax=Enterobacter kobei TaxID=208224 RepID=UPI0007CA75F6|nr:hypothetical protein [Enterobacter kobei]SAZ36552.1 Uncharacterised protein [Enterobacter kobei]
MSTITKQWLQQKIADMEATRDEIPFGLDEDDSNTLAAMKLALASLEAEAVGYMNRFTGRVFTLEEQPGADTDAQVYVPVYAAPPAPVAVPAAMEMDDDFDSAFEHGKAVGWNAYRAAMLQSFGNSEQLNSPVIPDCWCRTCRPVTFSDSRFVVCPECGNKRCPHANDHRNACTGSNEPGQEGSAYPAAPQQEVESQIRKGKTVAMEEWELGARLTKHRFKP